MVNFGLNSASILGIFLAVAGASLYFLRTVRPELARDHDIFFAAVGLLCGFILLFQGWRLDPILQFGQFLLTGTTVFFAVESIRLRKVATEQARRNTPTVDKERPVSRTRVYREEDERDRSIPESYNAYEGATPNYDNPRLRGYDDPQPRSPRSRLREEEPTRRNSRSPREQYGDFEPTRRRPRNPNPVPRQDNYDDWSNQDSWDKPDYPNTTRSPKRRDFPGDEVARDRNLAPEPKPKPNPRRPTPNPVDRRSYNNQDLGRSYDEGLGRGYEEDLGASYPEDKVIATDYVDYQPLDDLGSDYDDDDSDYDFKERDNYDREPASDWDEPRRRDEE